MNFLQTLKKYAPHIIVAALALGLVLHVSVGNHEYDVRIEKDKDGDPTIEVVPTPDTPQNLAGAETVDDTEPIPDDLQFLVQEYAGDAGWNPDEAVRVFECESGDRSDAIADTNRELSVGLAQINVRAHKTELAMPQFARTSDVNAIIQWLEIPRNNIVFAAYLYRQTNDWTAWSCARTLMLPPYNK